ncbi:MAG TPA: helix-turn-helix domain-containing protein [Microlunatus sp.]
MTQPATGSTPRRRGPYANGERTRAALVDAALDVFAKKGSQRLSIRQIAEQIGTSHTALLHHFGSKDVLLEAVLARRREREGPEQRALIRRLGLLEAVPAIMNHNATIPGVLQLDTVLRAEALGQDHAARETIHKQQTEFLASVRIELELEDRAGHLRDDLDLDVVARLITSLIEGIQVAWLEDRSVDMGAHLASFMDLIRKPATPTSA